MNSDFTDGQLLDLASTLEEQTGKDLSYYLENFSGEEMQGLILGKQGGLHQSSNITPHQNRRASNRSV